MMMAARSGRITVSLVPGGRLHSRLCQFSSLLSAMVILSPGPQQQLLFIVDATNKSVPLGRASFGVVDLVILGSCLDLQVFGLAVAMGC